MVHRTKRKKYSTVRKSRVRKKHSNSLNVAGCISATVGVLYAIYIAYVAFKVLPSPDLNFHYLFYAFSFVPISGLGCVLGVYSRNFKSPLGRVGFMLNGLGLFAYVGLWILVMSSPLQ